MDKKLLPSFSCAVVFGAVFGQFVNYLVNKLYYDQDFPPVLFFSLIFWEAGCILGFIAFAELADKVDESNVVGEVFNDMAMFQGS